MFDTLVTKFKEGFAQKHIRNNIEEIVISKFFQWQFHQLCFKYAFDQMLVKIWCLKYQKLFKTLIISRSLKGM